MFYKNNWLAWAYDDGPEYGPKLTPTAKFTFNFKKTVNQPVKSYYTELLNNASLIRDTFTEPLDLLLSGGIDSEVILRVYTDLKIPINVYIFKYENNYNLTDVTQALKICQELNVTPKIVDFNLAKFFENEAYDIWNKVYANNAGWLVHMKLTEYVDGLPIIGMGDPYWERTSRDLKKVVPWIFRIREGPHHCAVYHKTIGRSAITDWYEYSPEVLLSYSQHPVIQQLIKDQISGKLTSISSKPTVHQEYWPTIDIRNKLTGFETPTTLMPGVMEEFTNTYCKDKVSSKQYRFLHNDFINLF